MVCPCFPEAAICKPPAPSRHLGAEIDVRGRFSGDFRSGRVSQPACLRISNGKRRCVGAGDELSSYGDSLTQRGRRQPAFVVRWGGLAA